MSLRELYQEMILDHGKQPRNFGCLPHATHSQTGHNTLCGDRLTVYVVEKNGKVEELCFEGKGCAISVASASLMTEFVKGKTVNEIKKIFDDFYQLVTKGSVPNEDLGKLTVFSNVSEFPVRVKCVTLAWHALQAALQRDAYPVSTE